MNSNNEDAKKCASEGEGEGAPSKRRGRKPSGLTRAEIESRSAERYRKGQIDSGRAQITPYVSLETKKNLASLKTTKNLETVGHVIDSLVADEMRRIEKIRSKK